jgi:hypothetical protein
LWGGREITAAGDGVENVVEGIGGIGAEFEDIYVDVEEEEGMRRECGLTVDGMSDATFIFPQSIVAAKLCAIVSLCRRLASHGGGWKKGAVGSSSSGYLPSFCILSTYYNVRGHVALFYILWGAGRWGVLTCHLLAQVA